MVRSMVCALLAGALCTTTAMSGVPQGTDLAAWRLPAPPAQPDNIGTDARVALGKMLFFEPRISANGNMSCASCHNPSLGWSDGLDTAVGHNGKKLARATPTIVNGAYQRIFMWDGRKPSLEHQALGPMEAADEMRADWSRALAFLNSDPVYVKAFAAAYPGEPVNQATFGRAVAAFERTIIVNDTPFDRWLNGEPQAMSASAQRGFALFTDSSKGNCAACHTAPTFSDDGFHNLGLKSFAAAEPDLGRYNERRIASVKGAFKTPQLRDVARTAPYFHDGSARTLREVVEHYRRGGDVKTNLSANMKPLDLTDAECDDLVAFMEALSSSSTAFQVPQLP